jgi:hypothetical protein
VPCKLYNDKFTEFTVDPWECLSNKVKEQSFHGPLGVMELKNNLKGLRGEFIDCKCQDDLDGVLVDAEKLIKQCMFDLPDWYWGTTDTNGLEREIENLKSTLSERKKNGRFC